MSEWIQRREDEMQRAYEQQQRREKILPDKAEQLWRGLILAIRNDVQQINNTAHLKTKIGGNLSFRHEDLTHKFRVSLDMAVGKSLSVEFLKEIATINATFF